MRPGLNLEGVRRAFLDTAPVIYALENDATYGDAAWFILKELLASKAELVASPITLAECLAGTENPDLLRQFVEFLTGTEIMFQNLTDIDALQAGVMRRQSSIPLADCL